MNVWHSGAMREAIFLRYRCMSYRESCGDKFWHHKYNYSFDRNIIFIRYIFGGGGREGEAGARVSYVWSVSLSNILGVSSASKESGFFVEMMHITIKNC